jgi:DeoR/GlpR family transcriptional regulator of sugar metabolism
MGRTALAKVCDLAMIDRIVTDREPPAEIRGAIEAADVELIVVGTGGANND